MPQQITRPREDEIAWILFFSAIKSWQYHPGATVKLPTSVCASIADEMLAALHERRKTWAG